MKLIIIISLILMLFTGIASAWDFNGMSSEYGYNTTTQIMTDHTGIIYTVHDDGVVVINNERYMTFAIRGDIGANTYTYTSMDYSWTWHIENNSGDYIFWAENNNLSFIWKQYFYFYANKTPMKIKHYLENNIADITNAQMFYLTNVTDNDSISRSGVTYRVGDVKPLHLQGNFNNVIPKVTFNGMYNFDYRDLVYNNFTINEFYIGNGNVIGHPSIDIMAVGFTKNGGIFPKGAHVWIDPSWGADNTIVSGLGDVGDKSAPTVFKMDNTWCLISGEFDGNFNGFNWTGSSWQNDGSIVSGLGDVGGRSTPTTFKINDTWYLISGEFDGNFNGFNWTGSSWQSDSGIVSGLGSIGLYQYSTPEVFKMDGIWYLISGELDGTFNGFNWTGSTWQNDSNIVLGLGNVGGTSTLGIFQNNSIYYLISGRNTGSFVGFNWTGSSWQSDIGAVANLIDVGLYSNPDIFQKGNCLYLITGASDGTFDGYNSSYVYDYINWHNISRNYRKKIIIDHVNPSGEDLYNYPAFLNITKDNNMQSDYDDLLFYDMDGNLMAAELEKGYTDYALVWVNITTLDLCGVTIYMYYGNAACSDSWDMYNVWNTNYKMVQHLQESPANGSAGHIDSTLNNNNGTPYNFDSVAGSTTDGDGKINGADEFDGVDDYLTPSTIISYSTDYTIAFWAHPESLTFRQMVLKDQTGGDYGKGGIMNAGGIWTIRSTAVGGAGVLEANNYEQDVWQHLVFTQTGGICTIYYDGVFDNSGAFTPITRTTRICGDYGAASENNYAGKIDEIQISSSPFGSDWIKQNYEMVVNQTDTVIFGLEEVPPYVNITLHSSGPCCIYTNYTGSITGNYIVESNHPLNYTSLAFLFGLNYTPTSDMHSYLKVPANDIAADGIYRAHNRNTTPYMTWESNDSITGGDPWRWSGGDNDSFWITKSQINSTHTWINMTGIASNVFPSMFYINRDAMYAAPKIGFEINRHQGIIIKMFDLEGYRNRNNDYYVSMYPDTQLESTTPTENIDIWYCNDSLDPLVDDPTTCACCVRMDTWASSRWMDHETWQPHDNVSYAKPLTAYAGTHPEIPPDEVVYLYFASNTVTSKSYILNATNHDPGICNITYAQTNTMWTYNELSDTSTAIAYTPSFYATFVRDYEEFLHHLYIANDQDVWGHSEIYNVSIGISDVPPTYCKFNYFWWDNTTDYYMNGTYTENFWVNLTYGFDPDNGAALTHVLSLYDEDYNFVAFINDSLVGNATDVDIYADIVDYNHGDRYMFKIVSTDNEGSTSVTWSKTFIFPRKNTLQDTINIIKEFPTVINNILSTFISFLPLLVGILMSGFLLIITVGVFSKFKRW